MTVDEIIDGFAKENEDQIEVFTVKNPSNNNQIRPNQGIS